jgi:DNA polymerase sigma
LNDDFFGRNADNINELEQLNWKLEVYGSASAGFSLRHSDIDIVLLTDIQRISLHQIFEKLKLKEWAIDCKFIQAQIPIITFQVTLQYSHVAFAKLTDKQFKKI